jgi:hypothetical protein
MLSIRLGYGRPALRAARIADRFCADDKDLCLPADLGRGLSQTFFLSFIPNPSTGEPGSAL